MALGLVVYAANPTYISRIEKIQYGIPKMAM